MLAGKCVRSARTQAKKKQISDKQQAALGTFTARLSKGCEQWCVTQRDSSAAAALVQVTEAKRLQADSSEYDSIIH